MKTVNHILVRHRIAHLDLCLQDQPLIPSRERGVGPLSGNLVKALPDSLVTMASVRDQVAFTIAGNATTRGIFSKKDCRDNKRMRLSLEVLC